MIQSARALARVNAYPAGAEKAALINQGGDLVLLWRASSSRPRIAGHQMTVSKVVVVPASQDWEKAMTAHGFLRPVRQAAA